MSDEYITVIAFFVLEILSEDGGIKFDTGIDYMCGEFKPRILKITIGHKGRPITKRHITKFLNTLKQYIQEDVERHEEMLKERYEVNSDDSDIPYEAIYTPLYCIGEVEKIHSKKYKMIWLRNSNPSP